MGVTMKILAIEASTEVGSVVVQTPDGQFRRSIDTARAQAENLLPMIDDALRDAGIVPKQLDAIAFGRGPGSFTGVRLASMIAQGLAAAVDVGVVAVSSLAAAAQQIWAQADVQRVAICMDARMGEVYFAEYSLIAGIATPVEHERLLAPGGVKFPVTGAWAAAGSGLAVYGDEYATAVAGATLVLPKLRPDASGLIAAAQRTLMAGELMSADAIATHYLRGESAWQRSS